MSANGEYIVSGGFGKQIIVRGLRDLKLSEMLPPCNSSIRSLDLTHDDMYANTLLFTGRKIIWTSQLKFCCHVGLS